MNNNDDDFGLSFILLLVIFIFPIFINLWFYKATSSDWMGFWGSYAGSIAGAAASLMALYITYKQNRRENQTTRLQLNEQSRLEVLPFIVSDWSTVKNESNIKSGKLIDLNESEIKIHNPINISISYRTKIQEPEVSTSNLVLIALKNVGEGAAINFKISCSDKTKAAPLIDLMPKESLQIYFLFPLEGGKYEIVLQYNDVQSRLYQQRITIEYGYKDKNDLIYSAFFKITDAVAPHLITNFKNV